MGRRGDLETCGQGHAAEKQAEGKEDGEVERCVCQLWGLAGGVSANAFVAFEGLAHPYKENLLRTNGEQVQNLASMPEIQQTLAEAR